jgi:hypothetical protein
MLEPLSAIGLLYDDDAYVENLSISGGPRSQSQPAGLMGRQVAGKEFLKACLTTVHGTNW